MKSITILLADDHELMRNGLRQLLEAEKDLEVVAEASTGMQAVDLVRTHRPDIVVMDVTMPDMTGISATHHIHAEHPDTRVLALSMHPAGNIVGEMIKAGARGYLTKNCAAGELVAAIRQVHQGRIYLSPEIPRAEVEAYLGDDSPVKAAGKEGTPLSQREKEVLQLVAEGKPTKAIAEQLFISEKTVGAHRQSIMDKLGLRSVAELTKYAVRHGLTSLD
jgi:DNA-binding NarL/FixJ family response regulator